MLSGFSNLMTMYREIESIGEELGEVEVREGAGDVHYDS